MRNCNRFVLPLVLASGCVLAPLVVVAEPPPRPPLPILEGQTRNQAPVWVTETLALAKEDQPYRVQLAATDAEGDRLNYRVAEGSQLPEWLALSATGALGGKPGFSAAGNYPVTLSVSDGTSVVQKTFSLVVTNTNRLPQWQQQELGKAVEGVHFEVQLTATDPDDESLEYIFLTGPQGVSISKSGLLQWTPGYDMAGKQSIKVNLADASGGVVPKMFSLMVENTNRVPVISTRFPAALQEGVPYSFVIDAYDPDGAALTYRLDKAPAGMILDKNVINWTPSFDQAGDYSFTLAVSDLESTTLQTVSWSVANVNRLPVWKTTGLGKAVEDKPFEMQLQAVDPDGTVLAYILDSAPAGMTMTPTGKLNWLPGFDAAGVVSVAVSVIDGKESVPLTLPLVVENVNRAPVIASEPVLQAAEAEEYRYTIEASDADSEALTYRIIQGPELMRLHDNELVWTPTYEAAGSYPVEIEVADAVATVRQKFTLVVKNTNRPPVFTPLAINTLVATENQPWTATVEAKDADNQPVTIQMVSGPPGMTFAKNSLAWKPDFEQAGGQVVVLAASDGQGRVEYTATIQVRNVNRLPVFTSKPVLQAREMAGYQYVIGATDPDRSELAYTLVKAPEGMSVTGNTVNWTPDYEQSGSYGVIVQMTDGEAKVEQSYTVTVANTNRAPQFNSRPPLVVRENDNYRYRVDVSDADRTEVQLKFTKGPKGMTLEGNQLLWTPDFEAAGSYPVELQASDGETVTTQSFEIQVNNTNRLPVVTSKPALNAIESITYGYRVTAEDADRQALTMKLKTAPAGMTMTNDILQWLPDYNQQGPRNVAIEVSDGEGTVEQAFVINTINTNRAPDFDPISDQTVVAGKTFKYQFHAFDVDGDPINVRLEYAPEGMILKEGSRLVWETNKKTAGSYTVILSASDGDLQGRRHFELHVHPED